MKHLTRSHFGFLLSIRWIRYMILIALFSVSIPVFAQGGADVNLGFGWLSDQQQPTGQVSSDSDIATPAQASQESLSAFELATSPATINQTTLRQFLVQNSHFSTEMFSRLLLAGIQQDIDGLNVAAMLLSLSNPDGGFGQFDSTGSTALETGYALQAIDSPSAVADTAVAYLLATQNPDGGWGLGSSSVFTTAIALRGLSRHISTDPAVGASLNAGRAYLYSQQADNQLWDSDFESAQALLALLSLLPNVLEIESAVEALMAAQLGNGSWSEDTYSTALALQVAILFETQKNAPPNETGSVQGRVLVAGSETPIINAQIDLLNAPGFTVQTDGAGQFLMDFVPQGTVTLVVSKPGYLGAASALYISPATLNQAGDIFLAIEPGSGVVSGRLFDDLTLIPQGGAAIDLDGPIAVSGISNSAGTFEFSALVAGSYTYEVNLAGYHPVAGTVTVPPGGLANIIQGLISDGTVLDGNPTDISAQIIDGVSLLPISGAVFELDGIGTVMSDADGLLVVETVPIGIHSALLSAPGYSAQTVSFVLPPGSTGNLGVIPLYPADGHEQATSITLEVTVVEQLGQTPIEGATVSVFGTTLSGISDQDGLVTLTDIEDPAFQVHVAATGYQPASFDINVSGFGTVAITLPLSPTEDPTISVTNFTGTVRDAETGNPVAGAELSILTEAISDLSGINGEYVLSAISVLDFTIEVNAQGYLPAYIPVTLQFHGDYEFDIELSTENGAQFSINTVTAPIEPASSWSTILVSASVENLLDEQQDALLIGEIRDPGGNLVGSTSPYAVGTEILNTLFSFAAAEEMLLTLPWDTAQHAPGSYVFHVSAVQPGSISRSLPRGIVLATAADVFTIAATSALGGAVQADPPLSQAGALTAIQLSAAIRNDGNVPITVGEYELQIIDSSDSQTVLTRTVLLEELDVNQIALADFGDWTPDISGQFDLLVQRLDQAELGSIEGSLLIGDIANAAFSVTPQEVPEGDQSVHAVVDLTGVDVTTGSSTDPLFDLVKEAVTKGGAFTGANSQSWHETNRCLGCHIQTQSLEGLSASIGKADIDLEATLFSLNVISSSQQPGGGLHISHPQHGKNQTALGLWGMKEWPEQQDVFLTELGALEYLYARSSGSSSSRYWNTDHPTGWLNNNDAMTAIVTQSAATIVQQVDENNLQSDLMRTQVKATYPTYPGTSVPRDIEYFDGWLYIAKTGGRIDRMRPGTGQVEVFVTGLAGISDVSGLEITADGVIYASGIGTQLHKIFPDGTIESVNLGVHDEYSDIKVSESGDIFVVSRNTHRILRVNSGGTVETLTSGGLLNQPYGMAMLPNGDLIVSSIGGFKLLRVTQAGVVSIYANGFAFPPLRMEWAADGNLYVLSGSFSSTSQTTSNGLNVLRPNGTLERIGTFNQTAGIEWVDDQLFISRWGPNTIQELEFVPQSTTIINSFRSQFPGIAQFFLSRYTWNDSETLRIAFRLVGLAEARPFISDTSKLAEMDAAIEFMANRLRSRQRSDGGWGRYSHYNVSDPLTTAWIGIALDYTNPSPDDPIVRSTMQYLLNQQLGDGSWTNNSGYFSTRLSATSLVMTYLPKALERLGGLDIGLQLTTRPDQAYRNLVPAADSVFDHGDNTSTYSWNLQGVTASGQQIEFEIDLSDMVLDENRPAALSAQLAFDNSFTSETVVVPVDIPLITAVSEVELDVSTDKPVYQAVENVDIQSVLNNLSLQFESGRLALQIRPAGSEVPLIVFDDQASDPLGQGDAQTFANQWNTSNQLAGGYEVFGQVFDGAGRVVAQDLAPFSIELTGAAIDSDLKTDRAEYEAWDAVTLNSTVLNPSANGIHAATLARLEVSDPAGVILLDLQFAVSALNIGDISTRGDNLALVDAPAGLYSAVLTVMDADGIETLSQSSATFLVNRTPVQSLSGLVVANPHTVYQGDPVSCTDTVSNISSLNPVQADVIQRLINLDTGEVMQETTSAVDLLPAASQEMLREFDSDALAVGGYSCALFAVDGGEEHLLDFDQFALLEPPIQIAVDLSPGEHGRILILLDEPGYFVDEEQCVLIEQISMGIPDQPVLEDGTQVTVHLLDEVGVLLESESVIFKNKAVVSDGFAGEPNLFIAVTKNGDFSASFDSPFEVNGSFEVVVDIETNGAIDSFSSGLIPVDCELPNQFQRTFGDLRISAIDAQPAVDSDEPYGPGDSATLNRQRFFLQTLLTEANWSYTIVTSAEAFVSEFRTGAYNLYGIFAEKEKLPTDFQGEVREAVYRGEGLLVAGLHDHRDSKIELPLGINATGKHNDALAVVVEDTLFAPADSAMILLDESVMRVELNGAQAAARFQLGGNQDDADIATAFFDYGQGRSVFASMDLLVQAVEAGNGSLYEELILRGFDFAYNPDSSQSSGSAVPLNLVLTNEGIATSGQVILTLPAGSELLDASADFGQEEGPYIWPFELAEAESITLLLWVSMPVDAGEFVAQVQTGVPGDWEDYESISLTLTPEEGVEAVQVGAELSALNLADPDTYHIASQAMDRALGYLEDMDYESALRELLKATLELDDVSNTEADAVRLSLSRLVRQVAFDLQQQPSP